MQIWVGVGDELCGKVRQSICLFNEAVITTGLWKKK